MCLPPASRKWGQAERATALNLALLWVLFEMGMHTSEICALHLCDVNRERRELLVWGKGAQGQRFTLEHEEWRHLHTYLDNYRLRVSVNGEQMDASADHLFLSETGQPLTKNCIAHVFDRLRNRVGITGKLVTASLLRKSFATCYLLTGGDLDTLQELLGQPTGKSLMVICTAEEGRSDGRSTGREVTRAWAAKR